jgi:hypothetical protein
MKDSMEADCTDLKFTLKKSEQITDILSLPPSISPPSLSLFTHMIIEKMNVTRSF